MKKHLIQLFKLSCLDLKEDTSFDMQSKSFFCTLLLAKIHGFSTRILDISFSPEKNNQQDLAEYPQNLDFFSLVTGLRHRINRNELLTAQVEIPDQIIFGCNG